VYKEARAQNYDPGTQIRWHSLTDFMQSPTCCSVWSVSQLPCWQHVE